MRSNAKCDCLFFIPSGGGGAEKVSINIANILKRRGVDVRVVFIKGATRSVVDYLSPSVEYDFIEADGKLGRYFGIFKYLRKYRPMTTFASLTALSFILIISKLFFKNHRVITRQCFMPRDGGRMVNSAIKHFFRYADVNIAQTEAMKKSMMETYGLKDDMVTVIHNPLDTEDIKIKISGVKRIGGNSYRFMAIGRIDPVKGFDTLIRAFAKVRNAHPEATLKIMGNANDAVYLESLHELARTLNLGESVEISGYTDNPYRELLGANCFVLSSITEGLPNVMLEAMYLNLPVAATTCIPFIAEAVKDGENGYTCAVGDLDGLAAAMEKAAVLYGKVNNPNTNSEIELTLLNIFKK